MPSARQPAAAIADRAERHVFDILGDLGAIERRALALIELTGADRAAVAREIAVDDDALGAALAEARKALRRTRGPLSSGARCERAERLASDRLDAPLPRLDRKWLEVHLARCPRCDRHLALLDEARTALRVTFLAEPPKLPPAPEPPALETAEPKAHLRVVPAPAPEPEPAGEAPTPEPVGGEARPTADVSRPTPAEEAPTPEPSTPSTPAPAAERPRREPRPRRAHAAAPPRSPAAKRAAKALVLFLAIAALIAAAIAGLSALDDDTPQRAPWDAPDAPEVLPAPLSDQ